MILGATLDGRLIFRSWGRVGFCEETAGKLIHIIPTNVSQSLRDSGWAEVPCFLASGMSWCSTVREVSSYNIQYNIFLPQTNLMLNKFQLTVPLLLLLLLLCSYALLLLK